MRPGRRVTNTRKEPQKSPVVGIISAAKNRVKRDKMTYPTGSERLDPGDNPKVNSTTSIESLITTLAPIFGDRLSTTDADRADHAADVSHHGPHPPQAVCWPLTTDEVVSAVNACRENRVPLIPYGTGTAVEGGVVAVSGGLCLDTSRMDRILDVQARDMDATVQAGVTREQLNRHLATLPDQVFFPVDPGADASLGGMAATSASGSNTVRYGSMRDRVLSLKAVMADGSVVRTAGRARKSVAGYDLTALLVGSEGTLAVITEVTLRLSPIPEAISAAVCCFETIESAIDAVIDCLVAGIPLARMELLDEIQIEAVNRFSGLQNTVLPTVFFEFNGSESAVLEQSEAAGRITTKHGGSEFRFATDDAERRRLWQARHDGYYATLGLREGSTGYVTDVCVPVTALAEAIARTRHELRDCSIPAPLFGHVGDGNFHVVFPILPGDAEELAEVQSISDRIANHALALGGTTTGEHGIGLGKRHLLEREHETGVAVMRSIKQALDPLGILNPGKVL